MSSGEAIAAKPARRLARPLLFVASLLLVLSVLFGLPWWTLVGAAGWPAPVTALGTTVFALLAAALPTLMYLGHGRGVDWASRLGDTLLGSVWVLFSWALIGSVGGLALRLTDLDQVTRARAVAALVAGVSLILLIWGYVEAMRVPRVKHVDVVLPRLGKGFDGLRIALLTDTHYGPIDRAAWSARVTEAVNRLNPDIVCHTGDIADGTATQRSAQAAPLGDIRAGIVRAYVTGNHEYFGQADGWLEHMRHLGWEPLHNRHLVLERAGDQLVLAGVDDITAEHSGRPGHRFDLATALHGADPDLPVVLLAHQPKQVTQAAAAGIDLQLSGHTHGGQIWPFHLLVRLDQPVVAGLTRHGARTQLYTSRGTGFWGPPLRVFAPSEITLLTLRSA